MSTPSIPLLTPADDFPDPLPLLDVCDGIVAVSREITGEMLARAYPKGIFPWYSKPDPVLWWATSPRMVLDVANLKLSRSLKKRLRQAAEGCYDDHGIRRKIEITLDNDPEAVMNACAAPREGQDGTWISDELKAAYLSLFPDHLHSIEVYIDGKLSGGLYGMAFGRMFYGESMFCKTNDASKMALCALVAILRNENIPWVDCQQETEHLASLGAAPVDFEEFAGHLKTYTAREDADWTAYNDNLCKLFADLLAPAGKASQTETECRAAEHFGMTGLSDCSYIPGQNERLLVAIPNPGTHFGKRASSILSRLGFRRSGSMNYRPACPGCNACLSYRVPVDLFKPDRSHRRCMTRNEDLYCTILPRQVTDEHYALFDKYLKSRHQGSIMENMTIDDYRMMVMDTTTETVLLEFRTKEGELKMVAITDVFDDGLSACYTFFDPDDSKRSLGSFGILTQIFLARRYGLKWTYLGYWVPQCGNMAYKSRFKPAEVFTDDRWISVESALK